MQEFNNKNPIIERSGETVIKSVSVSKHFAKLVDDYNLSPTDCFRRGVAVMLCDLGIASYKTKLNLERSKYVKKFIEEIEKEESNKIFIEESEKLMKLLLEEKPIKRKIKSVIDSWEISNE